jgi:hypothetical protein
MRSIQDRDLEGGRIFRRVTEVLIPNVRIVPSVGATKPGESERARHVGWVLPIDDTHTRMYSLLRVPVEYGSPIFPPRARHAGKLWAELSEEEHRRMPGDAEAMVSQWPVAARSREHLASSDRGVILIRQRIRRLWMPWAGEDPAGVARGCLAGRNSSVSTAGNLVVA